MTIGRTSGRDKRINLRGGIDGADPADEFRNSLSRGKVTVGQRRAVIITPSVRKCLEPKGAVSTKAEGLLCTKPRSTLLAIAASVGDCRPPPRLQPPDERLTRSRRGFNESRREEGTAARADCQKAAALAICAMRLRREPRRHALSAAARHAGRPGPGWRTAAFFAAEIWSSGGDAGIECAFILEWPRRAGSDGTAVRFGFRLREVRACWIICVVLPCR